MGAATARHLAIQGFDIAVIGPDEPADRQSHAGVFASHYDEGRITRIFDPDPTWALLAQRSLQRYREIEQHSGIRFYSEVGHLMVGPADPAINNLISTSRSTMHQLGADYEVLESAELAARFPWFNAEPGTVGLYQPAQAGYISPRQLVKAQCAAARQAGATIIRATATRVQETDNAVTVHTDSGARYTTDRVLIAAGGFSNANQLLPRALDLKIYGRTVVFAEIAEQITTSAQTDL